jgi:hypothetical protein
MQLAGWANRRAEPANATSAGQRTPPTPATHEAVRVSNRAAPRPAIHPRFPPAAGPSSAYDTTGVVYLPKKARTDDEALKEEIREALIDQMRTGARMEYVEMTCRECGKRQRTQAMVPDRGTRFNATKELWDRIEGKAATKREAPKVQTAGRPLEELSDDELEAILAGGTDGKADGGAAEEAA